VPSIDDVISKSLFEKGIILKGNRVFTRGDGGWSLKEKDPKVKFTTSVDDDGNMSFVGTKDGAHFPSADFTVSGIGKTSTSAKDKGPTVVSYDETGNKITTIGGVPTKTEAPSPKDIESRGQAKTRLNLSINDQVSKQVDILKKDPLSLASKAEAQVISAIKVHASKLAAKGVPVIEAVDQALSESNKEGLIKDIPTYSDTFFGGNKERIVGLVKQLTEARVPRERILEELIKRKVPEKLAVQIIDKFIPPQTRGIPTSLQPLTNDISDWRNNR